MNRSYKARASAVLLVLAPFVVAATLPQIDWLVQVKNKPVVDSRAYNFLPQSPGGTVAVGSNTKTLTPCPLGVNGADTKHYLYISGGVGTAEAVLITGGTCTSGASSGTLTFTAANTHSGAWTIQSATCGIQEAIVASPLAAGDGKTTVIVPAGQLHMYANIYISSPMRVTGQGQGVTYLYKMYDGGHLFHVELSGSSPSFELDHFEVHSGVVASAGDIIYVKDISLQQNMIHDLVITQVWDGIVLSNSRLDMSDVWVTNFDGRGIFSSTALTGVWRNVYVVNMDSGWDGTAGLHVTGTVDGLQISDSGFGGAAGGGSTTYGILFDPASSSTFISNVNLTNVVIDGFTSRCIWQKTGSSTLSPVIGGIWKLINVRCAAGGGSGYVSGAWGIHLDGPLDTVQLTNVFTIEVDKGVVLDEIYNASVIGSDIRGKSSTAGGQGLVLSTGAKTLQIIGNTIGYGAAGTTANGADDGIVIGTGTYEGIVIQGNTIYGSSSAINGAANIDSGVVANNPGYNPVGLASITVGASPYTYTAGASPEMVYIYGGTVSDIKRGATTVASASPAQVAIPPFGTVVVTYAVAPTMVKDIQ